MTETLSQTRSRVKRAPSPGAAPPRFDAEMLALRSHLAPLLEARNPAVIAITGCGPGEGVTTVARELSRVLASEGLEVLLCGPLDAPPPPGRPKTLERKVMRTVVPSLSFTDVSDLHVLKGDRRALVAFRAWVEAQKQNYAVVILDTPPILERGGWETLFRLEDGVLLVLEAERTRSAVLRATVDAIAAAGGHVLGIVFNRRRRIIPDVVYQWL